ncbi:spore protease YyaC [Anaerobacillus sp. MEB173]|uniref:spore protease YyaC n=1 Tax=Anaerobacillus sp. MEB173 TaxID=3383345 RepID=UPI003F8DB1AB
MIPKRKIFPKKFSYKVHFEDEQAIENFSTNLKRLLPVSGRQDIVIVCIGTDRSTGDSLGPLVGTNLVNKSLSSFHVYGTLENPVHAVNLNEQLVEIKKIHQNPYIIGVDACLGRMNSVGTISLADGPVKPGAAVNKQLPEVGDIHITGIVNIGGFMEYFVLQNTRLHVVIKISDIIAESIYLVDKQLAKERATKSSLLQSMKTKFV